MNKPFQILSEMSQEIKQLMHQSELDNQFALSNTYMKLYLNIQKLAKYIPSEVEDGDTTKEA
jgi:hypothetical protein